MQTANDEESEQELARWLVAHADQAFEQFETTRDRNVVADAFQLASHFRKSLDSERSRLLCDLFELRQRATTKFTRAGGMFFTRVGYEQSTSQAIANYKAKRFSGLGSVVDLCCGIGGDAVSIAEQVDRLAIVDAAPTVAEFARANIAVHGATSECLVADVRTVDLSEFDAWHIDPDRRVDGKRRSVPNACEPPLDEFLQLPGLSEHGSIKLSPAADATELLQRGAELEWIGNQHECQQQVAWLGSLALHPGHRKATWLSGRPNESNGVATYLFSESTDPRAESLDVPVFTGSPRYVYEPRAVVLASELDGTIASQFGLERLASRSPYLASNELVESPMLRRFAVIESLPYHLKSLHRRVQELGLRVTEVKKRGVEVSPEKVLRQLRNGVSNSVGEDGAKSAVVLVYPVGRSITVTLATRDD